MITENGSKFVECIVQCWEKRLLEKGLGGFDEEETSIGQLIRVVKEVETEVRGRIIGTVGEL